MTERAYIVGLGVTRQARRLEEPEGALFVEAVRLALDDAGLDKTDVDGLSARWPGPGGTVLHPGSADWATALGMPVRWLGDTYPQGPQGVLDAMAAVKARLCDVVLIVSGQAGLGDGLALYTRPENEYVAPYGSFTAAQFALVAQRYLHELGDGVAATARECAARIAADIRTMGSMNPEAVLYDRGVITVEDVLASTPIASPLNLLDVCLANEGVAAVIVASEAVARNCRTRVEILSGGSEWYGQQYTTAARFDETWTIGKSAARRAFGIAGLKPEDIDFRAFYDPVSFEVPRQFEALGYCSFGEGGAFAVENGIGADGNMPTNTDGGLLSYSHTGWGGPHLKVAAAARQIRGDAGAGQVPGVSTALATGAGAGAKYHSTIILGKG